MAVDIEEETKKRIDEEKFIHRKSGFTKILVCYQHYKWANT